MVMITFELDEPTAERLLEVAAREGIRPQSVTPPTSDEPAVIHLPPDQPSETVLARRRALAEEYGLDPDDPFLKLVGMIEADIPDVSKTVKETTQEAREQTFAELEGLLDDFDIAAEDVEDVLKAMWRKRAADPG